MKFFKGMAVNAVILSAAAVAALYLSGSWSNAEGDGKEPMQTPKELATQADDVIYGHVPAISKKTVEEELRTSYDISIAGEPARKFFSRCVDAADPSTMVILASRMSGSAPWQLAPDGGRTETFATEAAFRERLARYVNAERPVSIGLLGIHTRTAKALGLSPMVLADPCTNARAASLWLSSIYRQFAQAKPGFDRDMLVRSALEQYEAENAANIAPPPGPIFKRSDASSEADRAEPLSVTARAPVGEAEPLRAQEPEQAGAKSRKSDDGLIF